MMRFFILSLLFLFTFPAFSQSQYEVDLTWIAPVTSPTDDQVVSYYVYRKVSGGTWTKISSDGVTDTLYSDSNVNYSATYSYYVVSVDAKGNTSEPSNIFTITIPALVLVPVYSVGISGN